ncbi:coiled-coil domain-containing protein 167 isoform X5 [Mauremys reevesii]|uniref:coiled-coil domain-containing protein 167 isoform X5 n=1 Tax=Mauremys reevesii TaxID=260615 RepID=UPI00193F827E|nr:coiled-coil domain-containing protein 167 isoform X5 [Mauremys reevesii]XP_039385975.1 coiled-coil domain-containing protein 167 isoform X5 [Mauremys reevesii]
MRFSRGKWEVETQSSEHIQKREIQIDGLEEKLSLCRQSMEEVDLKLLREELSPEGRKSLERERSLLVTKAETYGANAMLLFHSPRSPSHSHSAAPASCPQESPKQTVLLPLLPLDEAAWHAQCPIPPRVH